jgi:hypothetical protein
MPILVKCACGKELRVKDELRGRRVKCPACGVVLVAEEAPEEAVPTAEEPAEEAPPSRLREAAPALPKRPTRRPPADEEDEPAPRSKGRRDGAAGKKVSTGLVLGLAGGGALLALACCGAGAFFLFRGAEDTDTNKTLTLTNGQATVSSRLRASDRDKPSLKQPSRRYSVKFEANKVYQIDMTSKARSRRHGDFDSYLYLEDDKGSTLAEDDDGGEGLNSRIVFHCTRAGDYAIIATTLRDEEYTSGTETGSFELTVKEIGSKDPPGKGQSGLVLNEAGQLGPSSPLDPERKTPCKVYTVAMKAGKTYQIDHMSKQFDAYLRLVGPDGKKVAKDDDSGGDLNARIRYQCTRAGEYRIYATCLIKASGSFRIEVREE